jgi:uncharacterized membrane protein
VIAEQPLFPYDGKVSDSEGGEIELNEWTFWNHVRTVTSLAAAAILTIASLK